MCSEIQQLWAAINGLVFTVIQPHTLKNYAMDLKPKPFQTDIFTLQVVTRLSELNLANMVLILVNWEAEVFMVIITFSKSMTSFIAQDKVLRK